MTVLNFQPESLTVLVVDDERSLRLLLGHAMRQEGYQVIEAGNGENCIALCLQQPPDLILLDAVLPNMDGFDCCAQLHGLMGDRCPPILMTTALSDSESVDRAFTVGATDFVTKPIHWPVLRQRVRRILQNRQALDELQVLRHQVQLLQKQLDRPQIFH